MKRIIRLTESDLTRIVRRVIRESEEESWTDEDQSEWDDIRSKGPYLKDFDNDFSKWQPEFDKWRNNPRYKELGDKMSRTKYKNSSVDTTPEFGSWSDEEEMEYQDIMSKGPYLKDFDNDVSKWEPEFAKWRNNPRNKELSDKRVKRDRSKFK